jgi:processive 1,2-diacylglycerol beta-glucosyltransferase
MSAKILIFYLVKHSGHHMAAKAIETALHKLDPSVHTICADFLAYSHPKIGALIQKTYMGTIRTTPELWNALYDSEVFERLTRNIRELALQDNGKMLKQFMSEYSPNAVVCTQAHPLIVMTIFLARNKLTLPLWGVVTDFVPHRFWVVKDHPVYAVPNETAANRLQDLGVDAGRIKVLGIPVSPELAEKRPAVKPRKERPRVLVMGGSRGLGISYSIIRSLDRAAGDFTIDVISGANRLLQKRLVRRRRKFTHPLRIRGYVDNAVEVMRTADLLVSKPGGLTASEALALGLPMIIVRALPGQERGNARYLTKCGAAIHLDEQGDIAPVVSALLGHPALLNDMKDRARALGRPDSALQLGRELLRTLESPRGAIF